MTELKAGRELDALVAEKVMGRKVEWSNDHEIYWPNRDHRLYGTILVPPFSIDIAAAWLVVEKLDALGFFVSLDRLVFDTGRFWRAETYVVDDEYARMGDNWHDADSAPLAICRAALAAMGAA